MQKFIPLQSFFSTHSVMDESYESYIKGLAETSANKVFFNSGNDCALTVFKSLYAYTSRCVKLFSGSLNNEVSNNPDYIEALDSAISRGASVKILVHDIDAPENLIYIPFYRRLIVLKEEGKNIEIKKTNANLILSQNGSKNEIHFCVCDDRAYRLEYDIEKRNARGNFNDITTSLILSRTFDDIFGNKELSSQISLA